MKFALSFLMAFSSLCLIRSASIITIDQLYTAMCLNVEVGFLYEFEVEGDQRLNCVFLTSSLDMSSMYFNLAVIVTYKLQDYTTADGNQICFDSICAEKPTLTELFTTTATPVIQPSTKPSTTSSTRATPIFVPSTTPAPTKFTAELHVKYAYCPKDADHLSLGDCYVKVYLDNSYEGRTRTIHDEYDAYFNTKFDLGTVGYTTEIKVVVMDWDDPSNDDYIDSVTIKPLNILFEGLNGIERRYTFRGGKIDLVLSLTPIQ